MIFEVQSTAQPWLMLHPDVHCHTESNLHIQASHAHGVNCSEHIANYAWQLSDNLAYNIQGDNKNVKSLNNIPNYKSLQLFFGESKHLKFDQNYREL
jgi:hypothetical protein